MMNYDQNNIWATDRYDEGWPDDSSEAFCDDNHNQGNAWGVSTFGATKNKNKQFNVRRKAAMGLEDFGNRNTLSSSLFSLKSTEPYSEKRQDTNSTPSTKSDGVTTLLASKREKHGVTGNVWGVASKSTNPTSGLLKIQAQEKAEREKAEQRYQPRGATTMTTSGRGGYVPPHKRGISSNNRWGQQTLGEQKKYSPTSSASGKEPNCTVRIGELPRSTTEVDLSELCRKFGRVSRIHIVTDRETKEPKGYAFVTFSSHDEAAKAVSGLEGKRHDYRILRADWARQRENGPTDTYRSGYGKPLPQTSVRPGYGKALLSIVNK